MSLPAATAEPVPPASILTQVDESAGYQPSWTNDGASSSADAQEAQDNSSRKFVINARGTLIELTQHEMYRLPQCILVGLSSSIVTGAPTLDSGDPSNPLYINFPPRFLQYTLDVFRAMSNESPRNSLSTLEMTDLAEAIRTKPAVIVLREDVDFYCLPPSESVTKREMNSIKRACGQLLVQRNKVLAGLRKSELPGSPEQHLIEMLCSTGFSPDETWGYREMEPNKTVVSSLALVRLRTDLLPVENHQKPQDYTERGNPYADDDEGSVAQMSIDQIEDPPVVSESDETPATSVTSAEVPDTVSPTTSHESHESQESQESHETHDSAAGTIREEGAKSGETSEKPAQQTQQQPAVDLAKSQKLFLFWKKPARKCWWDTITFSDVPGCDVPIKVHLRSVWTLELCIVD